MAIKVHGGFVRRIVRIAYFGALMMDIVNNFHDDMMRADIADCTMEELQEMLKRCVEDELFEIARVVQLEIDSRPR